MTEQLAGGATPLNLGMTWTNSSTGKNNGRLQKLVAANSNSGLTLTQSFSYDALNRITGATEKNTGGAQNWSQSYDYDQYGNLFMPSSSGPPAAGVGPAAPTVNPYSAQPTRIPIPLMTMRAI